MVEDVGNALAWLVGCDPGSVTGNHWRMLAMRAPSIEVSFDETVYVALSLRLRGNATVIWSVSDRHDEIWKEDDTGQRCFH